MMKSIPLQESYIQGAISVRRTEEGLQPYRAPYEQIELFPSNGIGGRAREASGVRIAFVSDSTMVRVRFVPLEGPGPISCVCRNTGYSVTLSLEEGETEALFDRLPTGRKLVEVYVPHNRAFVWTALELEEGAEAEPYEDKRPRWLAYGSSITQGCSSKVTPGPLETWPVVAAGLLDYRLTNLGFGGSCHMEPMVARMMRDEPADLISLCLGINIYGGQTLNGHTFRTSAIGFIQLLRERHRSIPIVVISPIYCASREETPNGVGLSLQSMRSVLSEVVELLRKHGDERLHYVPGLELLGADAAALMPDELHPNAEGYRLMAERFSGIVKKWL
ncbi:SGNH/GDSL hydrolase family protein [Paenibacillus koleovorans]|uniref:SGNH/GDSL hydrolase family protein n=1 Tax=Paenibacillus koleovorans TaxID=121608 RepID=UPI000FDAE614|nr:SGNH/GDSL hydrolase family protein [Paenibacillus koleovorans]